MKEIFHLWDSLRDGKQHKGSSKGGSVPLNFELAPVTLQLAKQGTNEGVEDGINFINSLRKEVIDILMT